MQGPARDKEKREKERSELRDLVKSVTWIWLIYTIDNCFMLIKNIPTFLGREELACA